MVKIMTHRRINFLGPTQIPKRMMSSNILKIPVKGAESLGVSQALTLQLRDTIEKILNRCIDKDRYFIVVKCNLLPGRVIQNKVIIVNTKKTKEEFTTACKTFNTMCFMVDNRAGTIEDVWILPKDTVFDSPDIPGQSEKGSERIRRSVEDMPILHG
jgi:hypothetical protein